MGLQYQDFLLEEFRTRRSRNPSYSLRAFARDIGMPASKLSQNLRGLCGISVAKAEMIAEKIQMRAEDRRLFLALVESQHARSRVAREQARSALERISEEKTNELSIEKFAVVRDWYHMAILELMDIVNFKSDMDWIAGRLNLPRDVVVEAIGRLEQVGLIRPTAGGGLSKSEGDLELPSGMSARSVREHHKQILTKALVAADDEPSESSEYCTQTFAVSRALLPEIKSLIREFQRQISRLSQSAPKDDVFALSVQLFPLLSKEKEP